MSVKEIDLFNRNANESSLRRFKLRVCQQVVFYTKLFDSIPSFRNFMMLGSQPPTYRVVALEN